MKFNQLRLIFFLIPVVLLSSCLGTNTPTATSSNASFVSMTYVAKNKITTISATTFTLVDNTIVNLDSLPFKTSIDSVTPAFTFASSAGAIMHFRTGYKKDSLPVNGTDTIDFRQLLRIRNYASDSKTYIDYNIKVNVHQVDPELYNWSQVSENLGNINATSQKTVILNNTLFYYLNNGISGYLYTSTNGINWHDQSSKLTGLPVNTPLNDMIQFNGKLYLTQNGSNLYSSSDGFTWTKKTLNAYTFNSLAFVLNNKLWAVVQSNGSNYFAISNDGNFLDTDITTGTIPVNFPVRNFASVSYSSSTGKPKVLVLGGYSTTGLPLKNNWSSEDGVYWVDFSNENHTLDTLAVGASLISYDSKLFVLGLRNDKPDSTYYRVSKDEGLSWQRPDTLRNRLPKDYSARSYQSVVVLNPMEVKGVQSPTLKQQILDSDHIFIVGGISGSTVFSDIWTGKLNRKNFLRQ